MTKDIFSRLRAGRPPVEKAGGRSPAQKLLDWLQRWDRDVVCARDIHVYGPGSLRHQKKSVTDSAEILVKNGWLTPVPTRHGHKWRIVRRPIADPTILAE
jgi:hypothetical protein